MTRKFFSTLTVLAGTALVIGIALSMRDTLTTQEIGYDGSYDTAPTAYTYEPLTSAPIRKGR